MTSDQIIKLQATVPAQLAGVRLDQAAAELFPDYSRARLQHWIKAGLLRVDGEQAKPKVKLGGGENLQLEALQEPQGDWVAQDLPLDIVFEDEQLLVINKPAGLVVHPAAGNADGTLLNALLHHFPGLESLPRAGIVHRLDKDTTGLMVVAKTLKSHQSLVDQLQKRSVGREYIAVVQGELISGGRVEASMGRHPRNRKKMAVVDRGGKEAITRYWIEHKFQQYTALRVQLETGRTHQIRVHMSHKGYPLVGDATYGGRFKIPKGADEKTIQYLKTFPRQALHARKLKLLHPQSNDMQEWQIPLPEDMESLISLLKENRPNA